MKTLYPLGIALMLAVSANFANAPAQAQNVSAAIAHADRTDSNRERDAQRHPDEVLAFADIQPGEVILDYGSGGGYYTELFGALAGPEGRVYAHNRASERFEEQRTALEQRYAPFGNVELLALESGAPLPLETDSVDTVMLSYLYHHMHYAEDAGEELPPASAALMAEFLRVLKPGGNLIVIEHAAPPAATRAESAALHRVPPVMAQGDITGAGFEYAGEAPEIYFNPYDDLDNVWSQVGLRGHTTSFVHKYRAPES